MRIFATVVLALVCSGCATIYNGSWQEVPVDIPEGTIVSDSSNTTLLVYKGEYQTQYLRLQRKHEQLLTFSKDGDSLHVRVPREFEGGWIVADVFFYFWGLIVDWLTGAWHSFDGVRVTFDPAKRGDGSVSIFEPKDEYGDNIYPRKKGITLRMGYSIYRSSGTDEIYPEIDVGFSLGAAYTFKPKLHLFADWTNAGYFDFHPTTSLFTSDGVLNAYEVGAKYFPVRPFYVGGAVGYGDINTSRAFVKTDRYHQRPMYTFSHAGIPIAAFGVGLSGSLGFIELQSRFGLVGFDLASGERGYLHTVGLRGGLNVMF